MFLLYLLTAQKNNPENRFGTGFFRAMSQIASAATSGQPNGSLPEQSHAAMSMAYAAAANAAAAGAAGIGDSGSGDGDEEFDDMPPVDDKRTKRGFSKRVTLRDLERYFEYPIEEVSKMMGVSTTIIKRLCRKYGIKRWPYRQVRIVFVFRVRWFVNSCCDGCGCCDVWFV